MSPIESQINLRGDGNGAEGGPCLRGDGRTAWISGGASGIGRAAVRVFARAGYRVLVADRDQDGEVIAQKLEDEAEVRFVQTDVMERRQVRRAIRAALDLWGRLDFVFNCAGVLGGMGLIETVDEAVVDEVLDINLKGALYVCREAIGAMREGGGGAMVNVASISAWNGSPAFPVYSASKAGVVALTRAVARRAGRYNVRVNCISPGSISGTGLEHHGNSSEDKAKHSLERQAALMRQIPLGRVGTPEDVAHLALFLASPLARHIHGTEVIVDGGERLGYR